MLTPFAPIYPRRVRIANKTRREFSLRKTEINNKQRKRRTPARPPFCNMLLTHINRRIGSPLPTKGSATNKHGFKFTFFINKRQ